MGLITAHLLKQTLQLCKFDAKVIFPQGLDFKFIGTTNAGDIVMSLEKPVGICPKCGERVFPELRSELEEYFAYCPHCDENFYEFETLKID